MEPLVREALAKLLPLGDVPAAAAVGGYWTRSNDVEVDIVGADRDEPPAESVLFARSVKRREGEKFGRRDYNALASSTVAVSGFARGMPLIGVSRSGFEANLPLAAALGPEELLAAWTV